MCCSQLICAEVVSLYRTTVTVNSGMLSEFIRRYQHRDKFLAFCKDCKNFNTRWSCPPLAIDVDRFLQNYNYIYVIGVQIIYDADTIQRADTSEKIKHVTTQSLQDVKTRLSDALLALEKQIPGSISLASGGCSVCQRCRRCDQLPCRYPEKMRYSLDSFGFDLTALTSDALQIELKWAQNSLPAYYTLVHALLTRQAVPDLSARIQL